MENRVYVLEIPHLMPPTLSMFKSLNDVFCAYGVKTREELEDAMHDLHSFDIFNKNGVDIVFRNRIKGHQGAKIEILFKNFIHE